MFPALPAPDVEAKMPLAVPALLIPEIVVGPLTLASTDPPCPEPAVAAVICAPCVSDNVPSCRLMSPALPDVAVVAVIEPSSTLKLGAVIEMAPALPVSVLIVDTPPRKPVLPGLEMITGPLDVIVTAPLSPGPDELELTRPPLLSVSAPTCRLMLLA